MQGRIKRFFSFQQNYKEQFMAVTHLTDADYLDGIKKINGGIILFYKKLCPHCFNMQKVLEKLSAKRNDISIIHIDSEENPQAMASLDVERLPTLVIIKNGNIAGKHVGLMNPRETASLFDSL
jgi:thioredoxin 1